ncbi:MAG: hypothetical protein KGL39_04775 [Patescibacteria group bacterium]|nr:hypothetical protein [Patescibacteria group bacterium]
MTEEEAKTKWCPASFAIPVQLNADGSGFREGGPWPCSASNCMAWRVNETASFDRWGRPTTRSDEIHKTISLSGFCGLAGKP